jgi:hypothetical protein
MAQAQQHGFKRAAKVLKRKQTKAREDKKKNIKQAIYAFEKAMKEAGADVGHDHAGHDHAGHDHDHEGHDHK